MSLIFLRDELGKKIMQGINIVGVQFKRAGKIYDFSYQNLNLCIGDRVLVETELGPSVAKVVVLGFLENKDKLGRELKPVQKKMGQRELYKNFHLTPAEISRFAKRKITRLKLDMRILKSEVLYGGNRITIFFSSPGRVDFRELVRDLAGGLKARVELKQVGARDETKLLGGIGICGREYCCSSFLREFVPVSIKMAKNQNLALNPTKVSGGCGRLLCCLTYENETYNALRQTLPPSGVKVELISDPSLFGVIKKSDLLNQKVHILQEDGEELIAHVNEIKIIDRSSPVVK